MLDKERRQTLYLYPSLFQMIYIIFLQGACYEAMLSRSLSSRHLFSDPFRIWGPKSDLLMVWIHGLGSHTGRSAPALAL